MTYAALGPMLIKRQPLKMPPRLTAFMLKRGEAMTKGYHYHGWEVG